MKKTCRKFAPRVNSRSLFNFIRQSKTTITCKEFFCKSDILKENFQNFQNALKKITLFFFGTACHPYDARMLFVCHVIRMSLVCTRILSVCHVYVLVCYPYVTRLYSYVIRMSRVCTRMSSICHSYVLVCHLYVTRI